LKLNFTVFTNKQDMNVLVPDLPIMNSVPLGQSDRYEYFAERECKIFIEAYTCGGKILVHGTPNQANLINENYEMTLNHEANSHLVGTLTLKPGTYYFAVKSIFASHSSGDIAETTYIIKVQEFPANEAVPYEFFFQP